MFNRLIRLARRLRALPVQAYYTLSGWRFSDPTPVSNPIPGNHGHPATGPIPFFLAGGSRAVRPGASPTQAFTLDVAPTVGAYFGLPAPAGGYDGVSRL